MAKHITNEDIVKSVISEWDLNHLMEVNSYINSLHHLKALNKKLSQIEIKAMFDLRNKLLKDHEYGYHCATCRKETYRLLSGAQKIITTRIEYLNSTTLKK